MKIRLALPVEAEECWNIRNQAIRYGCKNSYDDAVIAAWTPEKMPESYWNVIVENPFFVVDAPDGRLVATGFLDLSSGSVEVVFTLPQYTGKGEPASPGYRRHSALVQHAADFGAFMPLSGIQGLTARSLPACTCFSSFQPYWHV
ncbi:GNAT family N-acetyltransferase [Pantoea piersonii]|uniref:GNAT family N-acetyltransferase n=1 Tax=Pantoea piersonii TaxID=2364647 RepID=UPI0028AFEE3E|nr:GNAT family N-acetyltransferase [Pantoea piersonii]